LAGCDLRSRPADRCYRSVINALNILEDLIFVPGRHSPGFWFCFHDLQFPEDLNPIQICENSYSHVFNLAAASAQCFGRCPDSCGHFRIDESEAVLDEHTDPERSAWVSAKARIKA
jgi:hypothetical protein